MDALDKKLTDVFAGKVVRKDLVRKVKVGANVPVFVLEYLLGKYCATEDEAAIEAIVAATMEAHATAEAVTPTPRVTELLAREGLMQREDTEAGEPKPPVYVHWLVPGDPGDETIREYWERSRRGELSPAGLVDLGTMLFERGYPKDALEMYREALHRDKTLYEAWFRVGVVEHRAREYEDARHAYQKCLDLMSGHGWCNFYLGLLEEQTGHPSKALEHFEKAYEHAPGL